MQNRRERPACRSAPQRRIDNGQWTMDNCGICSANDFKFKSSYHLSLSLRGAKRRGNLIVGHCRSSVPTIFHQRIVSPRRDTRPRVSANPIRRQRRHIHCPLSIVNCPLSLSIYDISHSERFFFRRRLKTPIILCVYGRFQNARLEKKIRCFFLTFSQLRNKIVVSVPTKGGKTMDAGNSGNIPGRSSQPRPWLR